MWSTDGVGLGRSGGDEVPDRRGQEVAGDVEIDDLRFAIAD